LKAISESQEYAALQAHPNDDPVELQEPRSLDKIEPNPNLRPTTSLQPGEAARILAEIRDKDRAELRAILPTLTGDVLLTIYLKDLSDAEQKYAKIENDFADEHPEIVKVRNVLKQIDRQIENRIDGILAGLETKASVDTELSRENPRARETARSSDAVSVPREVVRVTPSGPLSVHARVGGMVEKVLVGVGEAVKKGQPLLEIDNSAARSRLNTAEARAKIAEADLRIAQAELNETQRQYDRTKQLAEDRLAPESSVPNLEKVKAAIVKAEAQAELAFLERDQAKQDLDKYILRAPRDGTISFIIHEGYLVPEGGGKILAEIRTKEGDRAAYRQAVERLRQELTDLRAKEAELLQEYTPKHSAVLNVQRRIATLENRLRQEEVLDSNAEQ